MLGVTCQLLFYAVNNGVEYLTPPIDGFNQPLSVSWLHAVPACAAPSLHGQETITYDSSWMKLQTSPFSFLPQTFVMDSVQQRNQIEATLDSNDFVSLSLSMTIRFDGHAPDVLFGDLPVNFTASVRLNLQTGTPLSAAWECLRSKGAWDGEISPISNTPGLQVIDLALFDRAVATIHLKENANRAQGSNEDQLCYVGASVFSVWMLPSFRMQPLNSYSAGLGSSMSGMEPIIPKWAVVNICSDTATTGTGKSWGRIWQAKNSQWSQSGFLFSSNDLCGNEINCSRQVYEWASSLLQDANTESSRKFGKEVCLANSMVLSGKQAAMLHISPQEVVALSSHSRVTGTVCCGTSGCDRAFAVSGLLGGEGAAWDTELFLQPDSPKTIVDVVQGVSVISEARSSFTPLALDVPTMAIAGISGDLFGAAAAGDVLMDALLTQGNVNTAAQYLAGLFSQINQLHYLLKDYFPEDVASVSTTLNQFIAASPPSSTLLGYFDFLPRTSRFNSSNLHFRVWPTQHQTSVHNVTLELQIVSAQCPKQDAVLTNLTSKFTAFGGALLADLSPDYRNFFQANQPTSWTAIDCTEMLSVAVVLSIDLTMSSSNIVSSPCAPLESTLRLTATPVFAPLLLTNMFVGGEVRMRIDGFGQKNSLIQILAAMQTMAVLKFPSNQALFYEDNAGIITTSWDSSFDSPGTLGERLATAAQSLKGVEGLILAPLDLQPSRVGASGVTYREVLSSSGVQQCVSTLTGSTLTLCRGMETCIFNGLRQALGSDINTLPFVSVVPSSTSGGVTSQLEVRVFLASLAKASFQEWADTYVMPLGRCDWPLPLDTSLVLDLSSTPASQSFSVTGNGVGNGFATPFVPGDTMWVSVAHPSICSVIDYSNPISHSSTITLETEARITSEFAEVSTLPCLSDQCIFSGDIRYLGLGTNSSSTTQTLIVPPGVSVQMGLASLQVYQILTNQLSAEITISQSLLEFQSPLLAGSTGGIIAGDGQLQQLSALRNRLLATRRKSSFSRVLFLSPVISAASFIANGPFVFNVSASDFTNQQSPSIWLQCNVNAVASSTIANVCDTINAAFASCSLLALPFRQVRCAVAELENTADPSVGRIQLELTDNAALPFFRVMPIARSDIDDWLLAFNSQDKPPSQTNDTAPITFIESISMVPGFLSWRSLLKTLTNIETITCANAQQQQCQTSSSSLQLAQTSVLYTDLPPSATDKDLFPFYTQPMSIVGLRGVQGSLQFETNAQFSSSLSANDKKVELAVNASGGAQVGISTGVQIDLFSAPVLPTGNIAVLTALNNSQGILTPIPPAPNNGFELHIVADKRWTSAPALERAPTFQSLWPGSKRVSWSNGFAETTESPNNSSLVECDYTISFGAVTYQAAFGSELLPQLQSAPGVCGELAQIVSVAIWNSTETNSTSGQQMLVLFQKTILQGGSLNVLYLPLSVFISSKLPDFQPRNVQAVGAGIIENFHTSLTLTTNLNGKFTGMVGLAAIAADLLKPAQLVTTLDFGYKSPIQTDASAFHALTRKYFNDSFMQYNVQFAVQSNPLEVVIGPAGTTTMSLPLISIWKNETFFIDSLDALSALPAKLANNTASFDSADGDSKIREETAQTLSSLQFLSSTSIASWIDEVQTFTAELNRQDEITAALPLLADTALELVITRLLFQSLSTAATKFNAFVVGNSLSLSSACDFLTNVFASDINVCKHVVQQNKTMRIAFNVTFRELATADGMVLVSQLFTSSDRPLPNGVTSERDLTLISSLTSEFILLADWSNNPGAQPTISLQKSAVEIFVNYSLSGRRDISFGPVEASLSATGAVTVTARVDADGACKNGIPQLTTLHYGWNAQNVELRPSLIQERAKSLYCSHASWSAPTIQLTGTASAAFQMQLNGLNFCTIMFSVQDLRAFMLNPQEGRSVEEVACGTGFAVAMLQKIYDSSIIPYLASGKFAADFALRGQQFLDSIWARGQLAGVSTPLTGSQTKAVLQGAFAVVLVGRTIPKLRHALIVKIEPLLQDRGLQANTTELTQAVLDAATDAMCEVWGSHLKRCPTSPTAVDGPDWSYTWNLAFGFTHTTNLTKIEFDWVGAGGFLEVSGQCGLQYAVDVDFPVSFVLDQVGLGVHVYFQDMPMASAEMSLSLVDKTTGLQISSRTPEDSEMMVQRLLNYTGEDACNQCNFGGSMGFLGLQICANGKLSGTLSIGSSIFVPLDVLICADSDREGAVQQSACNQTVEAQVKGWAELEEASAMASKVSWDYPYDPDFPFDSYLASQTMRLVHATYCRDHAAIENWTCCSEVCAKWGPFHVTAMIYNEAGDNLAFVGWGSGVSAHLSGPIGPGWKSKDSFAAVVFRGTNGFSLPNWMQNLDFSMETPWESLSQAKVHAGFLRAYNNIKQDPKFLNGVNLAIQKSGNSKLLVLGHSLGGAMAQIAAVDLAVTQPDIAKLNIVLYTIGSPRAGTPGFREGLYRYVSFHGRMTHASDIVVHLPPRWTGYVHTGVEMHFAASDGALDYMRCDFNLDKYGESDQPGCANGESSYLSISDHGKYLGIYVSAICDDVQNCQGTRSSSGLHRCWGINPTSRALLSASGNNTPVSFQAIATIDASARFGMSSKSDAGISVVTTIPYFLAQVTFMWNCTITPETPDRKSVV